MSAEGALRKQRGPPSGKSSKGLRSQRLVNDINVYWVAEGRTLTWVVFSFNFCEQLVEL